MATYAIGDVQGCHDELTELVTRVGFSPTRDRLWFVGDLVNRGPRSLDVLRFVRGLGDRAVAVLGNHELHLLAQHERLQGPRRTDTFADVLDAPDAPALMAWLRTWPLLHTEGPFVMVHAGLLPDWTIATAARLAREAEAALAAPDYRTLLAEVIAPRSERWDESLTGWVRLRVIVTALTRLRFCRDDGDMEMDAKGPIAPAGCRPWHTLRGEESQVIVCGHWSTQGLRVTPRLVALDSGCVRGGALSALRLEDRVLYQVAARPRPRPGDEGT